MKIQSSKKSFSRKFAKICIHKFPDLSTVPELRSRYSKSWGSDKTESTPESSQTKASLVCESATCNVLNLDLTLNFVTLIGRPKCNGRFCWQASLLHLRPSFSSSRMITRTIYVQDLSSGTVLWFPKNKFKNSKYIKNVEVHSLRTPALDSSQIIIFLVENGFIKTNKWFHMI